MVARCLAALGLLLAPGALARPVSIGLDLPAYTLPIVFGEETPPPVVLPPGPPQAPEPQDVVTLHDGRVYRGKILYQVQGGLLFSDPRFPQSFVIPFADIANLQHPGGPPPAESPNPMLAQRLMLEAQLRDLQLRADALTVFPAIGTMAGGAVSIGIGIFLYASLQNSNCVVTVTGQLDCSASQTDAIVFGLLAAIPGAVALALGTLELISITNRQNELQAQITQVKQSLAQVGSVQARAGVLPPRSPPALITLHF
jgi:hypothetical protein